MHNLAFVTSQQQVQLMTAGDCGICLACLAQLQCCCAERLPPSKLFQLTNQLLLGSFAGLRVASQAAFWAHARLKRQLWDGRSFPIQIRNGSDQVITMDAVCLTSVGAAWTCV